MHLFCFGTLMDLDIRRIVLGPGAGALPVRPAVLPGYRRVCVRNETYPAALPDRAATLEGVLTPPLSADQRDRVQFFEGFEFALERCHVLSEGQPVEALFCRATEHLDSADEPWNFVHWQRHHKPRYLEAVEAYMREFDRLGIEEAHALWLAERDRATT